MNTYIASPRTEAAYAYWLDRFNHFRDSESPSAPPTLEQAEAFLQDLRTNGCKPNTVIMAGRAIRKKLGIAVPIPKMDFPEPSYLSLDQVMALIRACGPLGRTIAVVMFDTALRISEVLELMVTDLRLQEGVAVATRKGGHRQEVSLGHNSVEALQEWLRVREGRDRRVFMGNDYQTVYRLLKAAAKKAGISDFHPHLLRHTRIRHLLDSGMPLERVSEVAGHRKLDTTLKIYGTLRARDRARYLDEVAPWG